MNESKLPPWSVQLAIAERVKMEDLVEWAKREVSGRQFPMFVNLQPPRKKQVRPFIRYIIP